MRSSPTSPPDPWPGLGRAEALARRLLDRLADAARGLGTASPAGPDDARPILLERVEVRGLVHRGAVSAGGSCRLLAAADGWVAVTLARPDDAELVPAWLGITVDDRAGVTSVLWEAVREAVVDRSAGDVVEQAQLLGLAVAAVPVAVGARHRPDEERTADVQLEARCRSGGDGTTPVVTTAGPPGPRRDPSHVRVVDLSSLWAGPLCGRLLADVGMAVTKVESVTRPDGARRGSPVLHDRLNRRKQALALPLATAAGRQDLRALLADADVVIEGSRPRALEQMGIHPAEWVAAGAGRVWVAITAYGRTGPWRNRVGFGDDTAAAGGLVHHDATGAPAFVGDAVADPLTGLAAAATALTAWSEGGGVVVDAALREVAREAASGPEPGGEAP